MADRKGSGDWKPFVEPGPGVLVGKVAPLMPEDPERRVREKAEVPPVTATNPGVEEIGGGKSKK